MSTRVAVALTTLVVAVLSVLITPVLWPRPAESDMPSSLLPFFIVLALVESILFGLGVAFLGFGLPIVQRAANVAGVGAWPTYVSIAWLLVSWWPHDNFHQVVGQDFAGLLYVEYGFHLTLMIGGVIIARFFLAALRAVTTTRDLHQAATSDVGRRLEPV